ncbi:MAG: hypothetical protein ABW185_09265 [Sedimenticola sp.]
MQTNSITDDSSISKPSSPIDESTTPLSLWRALSKIIPVLFGLFCGWVLVVAWNNSEQLIWTPENGIGYSLGLIGGVMMLTLLLYPLRKHTGVLGNKIPVKHWFKLHMILGTLGPLLVILHSNFTLASINGQVAMFSMLAVVVSGIVGRYIYAKVHRGLYGKRSNLIELKADSEKLNSKMGGVFELLPNAKSRMLMLEKLALSHPGFILLMPFHWLYVRSTIIIIYPLIYRQIRGALKQIHDNELATRDGKSARKMELKEMLREHKSSLISILEFQFYERVFSIWHLLHLPLFILLVATGFIHVYAVHAY